MRAFITGASGFIGSHLATLLLARRATVVCFARSPNAMRALQESGAQLIRGDITDRAALADAMRGSDVVFHLAGMYKLGPKYVPQLRAVNVEGARNVLETAAELDIPKIVHTSTVGVFGNTHGKIVDEKHKSKIEDMTSEYERTKWRAHYEVAVPLQKQGAPLIITQPGIVTGAGDSSPHMTQVDLYLRRASIALGAHSGATWAHVDDIAQGHVLALEQGKKGESYILAGPSITWKALMESWEPLTGIPAPRFWLSSGVSGVLQGALAVFEALGLKAELSAEGIGTVRDYTFWATADKAKRELGWQPRSQDEVSRDVLRYEMERLGIKIPHTLARAA